MSICFHQQPLRFTWFLQDQPSHFTSSLSSIPVPTLPVGFSELQIHQTANITSMVADIFSSSIIRYTINQHHSNHAILQGTKKTDFLKIVFHRRAQLSWWCRFCCRRDTESETETYSSGKEADCRKGHQSPSPHSILHCYIYNDILQWL